MRLTSLIVPIALACLASPVAYAGSGLKDIISKDRVQTVDGKMKIEEYQLCKVTVPGATKSSLQIKSYAEVPINAGISRDFFVSFESVTQTFITLTMGTALAKGTSIEPLKALDCAPISSPIGKVDLEINLYLTADGLQMAIVDGSTGKTTQESSSWEDVGK